MSAAVAELQRDIEDLEAEHDALKRTIARKHQELDALGVQIKASTDNLARIRAEIQKVKSHFGV
jgi:chromosome segregation ATPase